MFGQRKIFGIFPVLCAVLIFALALTAPAAGKKAACADDVTALFEQMRTSGEEELKFTCEEDFFNELSADDFALLEVLKVKSGAAGAEIRYSEGKRLIMVSNVTWTDAPWAECASAEEAAAAIRQFAEDNAAEGTLICPPQLLEELYDDYALYAFAAFNGLDAAKLNVHYFSSSGIIRIDQMTKQELPWYAAGDDIGFLAAAEDAAQRGLDTFIVAFDRTYFSALEEDPERMEMLVLASPIAGYATSTNSGSCTIRYQEVTYTNVPRLVCSTKDGIVSNIAAMGAAGETQFDLVLPTSLYDEVAADDFSELEKLEISGGMRSRRLSYQVSGHHLISYTEADIVSKIAQADTLEDAMDYCLKMADQGAQEMTLCCSEEIFDHLLGNTNGAELITEGTERIYDLIAMSGILDYSVSYSRQSRIITIAVKAYYPGTAIIHAIRNDDLTVLDERTYAAYEAASELLGRIMKGQETDLDKARDIHDALCSLITYVIDEDTTEDDTAIGALLNGEANCDGYADAFYLLGTMAGLTVRMQHGSSYQIGVVEDLHRMETHMWNLLWLDDEWRLVDVTWDDAEDSTVYTWFAIGEDRAVRMHIWNEDMAPALAPVTPMQERPDNEFAAGDEDELARALETASRKCLSSFSIVYGDEKIAAGYGSVLEKMRKAASASFRYNWNERMMVLSFYGVKYKAGAVIVTGDNPASSADDAGEASGRGVSPDIAG